MARDRDSEPVAVARFPYRHLAEMALGILEDEGIPGIVVGDDVGGQYPGVFGRVLLVVPAAFADRARQVLDEMRRDAEDAEGDGDNADGDGPDGDGAGWSGAS